MKASVTLLPRPVRWLLLVASAGAVLAADNSWMSTLKLDFAGASQWFSSEPVFDLPSADTAISASGPYRSAPQLSMGHLINGLLFSPPSRTWTLTPAAPEIASAWMTQQTAAAVTDGTTPYAPMEFGAPSFVSGPGSTSALLPAAPAAAVGFWSSSSSGNWSSIGNWAAFAIPDGASSIAHLDSHPLNISIVVTLDTSRTVGQLFIGDSTSAFSYTLAASGGSSLTFDNNGATGLLNQTATSFGDTISAPIIIG
ncbi:MAG: hypothetical protein QOD64_1633, partial [Verrucomicrobiota bacterium]